MMIFLICLAVIVAIVIGMTLLSKAADSDSLVDVWPLAAVIWWAGFLAVVVSAAIAEEEKGPCLRYEKQMIWNAATKTPMQYRVCVDRGEWVKP